MPAGSPATTRRHVTDSRTGRPRWGAGPLCRSLRLALRAASAAGRWLVTLAGSGTRFSTRAVNDVV